MLYELLTGDVPFRGLTLPSILTKVVNEEPMPVRELAEDAPLELVAICERAMAKDGAKRYQSAKELAEDVQRFLSGALVGAYAYRATDLVGRFVQRHR